MRLASHLTIVALALLVPATALAGHERGSKKKAWATAERAKIDAEAQHVLEHVLAKDNRTMHLCLDVVVQEILVICLGQPDQRHPGPDPEMGWLEHAVRVTERRPVQGLLVESQVGGSESR